MRPDVNDRNASDSEHSLAMRAAWLSYVGNYTQAQIAKRLGISQAKAHRLIASAHQNGHVKVFIEGVPAECVALEEQLIQRFGLNYCSVTPAIDEREQDIDSVFQALGVAGARYLYQYLEQSSPTMIGFGHGRTLAAVIDHMPHIAYPQMQFVALLGGLNRKMAANPFDVIYRLGERTGGQCYVLPVPPIADDIESCNVLKSQRSVQWALNLAQQCQLCVIGIGETGSNPFLKLMGMVTEAEYRQLRALNATCEILGQFLDAEGRLLDCDLNRRTISLPVGELRGREVMAIAGGIAKVDAICAALRSGLITSLIVDEMSAQQVLYREQHRAPAAE